MNSVVSHFIKDCKNSIISKMAKEKKKVEKEKVQILSWNSEFLDYLLYCDEMYEYYAVK
jgi:hypothetical protein